MMKKVMPPDYFFIFLALSAVIHFLFPVIKFVFFPYNYTGLILVVFGIIINIWADSIFKKKKTSVRPDEIPAFLIDFGPFRLSRHPMYLGMAAVLIGAAIFMGSLASFILPVVFVILMEKLFIPAEESNMKKKFGIKYLEYSRKVRRWI